MRAHFRFCLLPLLICSTAFCQESQVDALDAFSGSLIRQLRSNGEEKVHIVTNKTVYTAGEAIWFRTFLVHAVSEKISTLSDHMFVDLVDEKDSVLARSLLQARQQQTSGRLTLSGSLPSGTYWIRAYTPTMITGKPENAAVVALYVINPAHPLSSQGAGKTSPPATEQPPQLDMFPEGGWLVTGIETAIGFYAHDKSGRALPLTGYIKDNRDTVVARFTTSGHGLAKTSFSPFIRRRYTAVVSYHDKEYSYPLPPFNSFAGQLAVSSKGDQSLLLRTVLEDSIYRRDAVTYLIGLSRDSLCFASIGYGNNETAVPLSRFPDGFATFLLFDKSFRFLSERKVYLKNDRLQLSANLDKESYTKRSKATLATTVVRKSGEPVPTSLTVAVSDSTSIIDPEGAVQQVLKGARERGVTNWDLAHLTTLAEQDIDLLLQSTPSFYQRIVATAKKETASSGDSLFYIRGRLRNQKGEPLPNQLLSLISKAGAGLFVPDTTDAAGNFTFPLSGYMDSTQFIIQLNAAKGKAETPAIQLEGFSFPPFKTPAALKYPVVIPVAAQRAYARKYTDTTQLYPNLLQPVRLDAKGNSNRDDPRRLSSGGSVLSSEQLLKLGVGNIGTGVLRMPGVQMINGYLRFYGPDQFSGATANSEPMVLMNGIQVTLGGGGGGGSSSSPVIQYLNSLNPRELDFIEVLKGPEASIYGIRGGEGVIAIHTSSSIHQDFVSKDGNVMTFVRQGYSRPTAFPVVDYGQKEHKQSSFTDARPALYWNENELTDAGGKATFTFYTNDVPGRYRIVITGITSGGDLIYRTIGFTNQ